MTDKRLLLSLFFLFTLSAAYLFSVNERGLDPDRDKDWWSLAFVTPEDPTSLDFVISNHSAETVFHYAITSDTSTLAEGDLSVAPGSNLEHEPMITPPLPTGRISITVTHNGTEQTIYRSL